MADSFDPKAFQTILDHDNHETRAALRDLSKDSIFAPHYNVSLRY
jgi:acyl-CoA oxidase